ncbi:hypothetical protein A2U01_0071627, partial [Trifolium medium]|nr:hypothetical protein [Trifolium medium]
CYWLVSVLVVCVVAGFVRWLVSFGSCVVLACLLLDSAFSVLVVAWCFGPYAFCSESMCVLLGGGGCDGPEVGWWWL